MQHTLGWEGGVEGVVEVSSPLKAKGFSVYLVKVAPGAENVGSVDPQGPPNCATHSGGGGITGKPSSGRLQRAEVNDGAELPKCK